MCIFFPDCYCLEGGFTGKKRASSLFGPPFQIRVGLPKHLPSFPFFVPKLASAPPLRFLTMNNLFNDPSY